MRIIKITLLTFLMIINTLQAGTLRKWSLAEIKETHGKSMLGNSPFPEYFKIIEELGERRLVVKMKTQPREKIYKMSLNSIVVNKSVQEYGLKRMIRFNEVAFVEQSENEIYIKTSWTRDDKPDFKTSTEYKINFKGDGNIEFTRYNGKSTSAATYFEFIATYNLEG